MAGIVIIQDGKSIIVELNAYTSHLGTKKTSFSAEDVGLIYFSVTNDYINMTIRNWRDISVDILGVKGAKIDSILGVDCTTLDILFEQLTKLRSI